MTNASRGTANARHFYYALVFVITVLCGSLVVALSDLLQPDWTLH
ncbi:DUF3265 domain-containing protein [Vibrio anguillarum]|uniref:DUF3265 domain-containing protein n=1 Tax=Vibrio anguillarum TaxID=55601 RepID=A0ABR9ZAA0_VIBAN|nr:DUF3265 domain-containing protein [Vibrio anguillarum]